MKIGIIYIATGDYIKFWPEFYGSCERYFCIDATKSYELFTDRTEFFVPTPANVHIHSIEDKGWIVNTSYKSKYICNIQNQLSRYDYIFYLNSNFLFISPILSEEIIPQASHGYLTALSFEHYRELNVENYPYDRNPQSNAYIPYGEGQRYFQGGFYGGRTSDVILLSEWCKVAIDEDLRQHIIARFHDESYINRYLVTKKPKVLNDKYALQDIWPYQEEYKAIIRNKQQVLGIERLSIIRDNYTDKALSFLLDNNMCLAPWQIVNIYGGLGNQMFGYAFYKYIEKQSNIKYKCWVDSFTCNHSNPHNGYELSNTFKQIDDNVLLSAKTQKHIAKLDNNKVEHINEKYASTPQSFTLSDKPITIFSGCWQCVSYVEACANELRQAFIFNETRLNKPSLSLLPLLRNNNSVSVHIRRGDYTEGNNEWMYGEICTLDYYRAAMEKMKALLSEVPHFIFFTNDPTWVKEKFDLQEATLVDWNIGKDSWQDMYLMTVCHHHIIANSSFSWWGAWLGEHTGTQTIAPGTWYNTMDAPDLLPNHWLKLPIRPSDKLLKRLCNHLLLKSSFLETLGLQKGKMGSVLFFFYYSRYTKNTIYENYAEELFDEVYEEVNKGISYSFANGLCGIGWTVEYLVKNKFIEGDTDEALAEIDRQVMLYDPLRFTDYSFANGLDGVACYVLSRLLSKRETSSLLPFDDRYRDCLYQACKKAPIEKQTGNIGIYITYIEKGISDYSHDKVLKEFLSLPENAFGIEGMTWQTGAKMIRQILTS